METERIKCDDLQCPDNKAGFCQRKKDSPKDITLHLMACECKSFYRVFLDLEKHILPLWESMRTGSLDWDRIEDQIEDQRLYNVPYMVNGAFAAELGLKYLLEMANINYSQGNKGHDLSYLFGLLLLNKQSIQKDREAIIALLCKDGHQNLETLKQNISAWHDCYNRYRYMYSQTSVGSNDVFPLFVHTVCDYVISKSKESEEKDAEQSEI